MIPSQPMTTGRPPRSSTGAADAQIQLRVTRRRKAAYVHAAQKKQMTLSAWIFQHLDKAANHSED